jgi:hypothetical protein
MASKIGMARFDGVKFHFDAVGWALITGVAKRTKKSPKTIVTAALMRYIRSRDGKKA